MKEKLKEGIITQINEQEEIIEIRNTPFHLIVNKENGTCKLTTGNYLVTSKIYKNKEEAIKRLENTDIELIGAMIFSFIKNVKIL
jgi:hypothetical protein